MTLFLQQCNWKMLETIIQLEENDIIEKEEGPET